MFFFKINNFAYKKKKKKKKERKKEKKTQCQNIYCKSQKMVVQFGKISSLYL
jgi:hypothetical protein